MPALTKRAGVASRILLSGFMVSLAGPRAMIRCKPRQARKGATVAADACAVVWLAGDATLKSLAAISG